jgi:ribonuclease Z
MTKTALAVTAFFLAAMAAAPTAQAAPCLIVTLTGTQGGPPAVNGLAGAGTVVRYGDDANNCGAVKLQFDAGRGTTMRLSQLGVEPGQLNAIFFTHMHSDHVDGLPTSFSCAGTQPRSQRSTWSAVLMRYRRLGSP